MRKSFSAVINRLFFGDTMLKLLTVFFLLSVVGTCESPEELLNSTNGLTNESAALLLAVHDYDVTYVDGIYYLNGTKIDVGTMYETGTKKTQL
jgi:hypothetical protein